MEAAKTKHSETKLEAPQLETKATWNRKRSILKLENERNTLCELENEAPSCFSVPNTSEQDL